MKIFLGKILIINLFLIIFLLMLKKAFFAEVLADGEFILFVLLAIVTFIRYIRE